MSSSAYEEWKEAALALPVANVKDPSAPVAVLLLEFETASNFMTEYWKPSADGSRPGLQSVKVKLPQVTGKELRSLAEAAREAHVRVLFKPSADQSLVQKAKRASDLADAISSLVELELDDDVQEPADEALAEARARAATDATMATFIQWLVDITAIAEELEVRLKKYDDYDADRVEEVRALAKELSAAGVPRVGAEASTEVDMRNRLLTLGMNRLNLVRRAARYVFRDHPEILRKVTSSYQRLRRTAARKSKTTDATAAAAPTPETTE